MLVSNDARYLVTDPRYTEQACQEVQDAAVVIGSGDFCSVVQENQLLRGVRRVLFEADHCTVAEQNMWERQFPRLDWIQGTGLLRSAIASKGADALASMRRAQSATESAFRHLLTTIQPGMTEQEAAAIITYAHLRAGAECMAFDPIIASGPNAALPHARPTDRVLQHGDIVLVDAGCIFDGYASDMTRMVALGEISEGVRHVFDVVCRAQNAAISAAKAGMSGGALDAVARDHIVAAGYGDNFTHSLGHGIGYDVHEWPRIKKGSEDVLLQNATITVEPGVYLAGKFGVRVEDVVVLSSSGCKRLGTLSQELFVV